MPSGQVKLHFTYFLACTPVTILGNPCGTVPMQVIGKKVPSSDIKLPWGTDLRGQSKVLILPPGQTSKRGQEPVARELGSI